MSRDERINLMMHMLGYFTGLDLLVKESVLTPEEAARTKAYVFSLLAKKTAEIKNEIGRLQAVVQRLEAVCQQGVKVKPFTANGPDVHGLRQAVASLHGWTVSLVESDFYLLSALDSHRRAFTDWARVPKALDDLQLDRKITMQEITGKGRIPLGAG